MTNKLSLRQEIKAVKTTEDSILSKLPSLAVVKKEEGEAETIRIISWYILKSSKFFNFKRVPNTEQAQLTAKLIIKEFYYFNLADINLVFQGIMAGEYGEYYGKLDGSDFIKAFREYSATRLSTAEQVSNNKHNQLKEKRGIDEPQTIKERWQKLK
jgi:hypothetical protein